MGDVLLGCSGWSYKDWVGPFYKTEKESKLKVYSKLFGTAEINSTFMHACETSDILNGTATVFSAWGTAVTVKPAKK